MNIPIVRHAGQVTGRLIKWTTNRNLRLFNYGLECLFRIFAIPFAQVPKPAKESEQTPDSLSTPNDDLPLNSFLYMPDLFLADAVDDVCTPMVST